MSSGWESTAAGKNLGQIAVEFGLMPPSLVVSQTPLSKGKASVRGALGAVGAASLDSAMWDGSQVLEGGIWGGGYGPPVAVVAIPLAMIGGGIYGAFAGVSEHDLATANAAISAARADLKFDENLADALRKTLCARPGGDFDLVFQSPGAADAHPVKAESTLHLPPGARSPVDPYYPGTRTRLRLEVYYSGLYGKQRTNPPLKLRVIIRGNLSRVSDGTDAGHLWAGFTSKPRRYTEWAASNARLLRTEWEAATLSVATQIIDWLNGGRSPAPTPPFP
jgi:hypothetical protein